MHYLEFEKPIEKLISKLKMIEKFNSEGVDTKKTIDDLKLKIKNKRNEIYSELTAWQKVQLSRHPQRPYTLDYILKITNGDFIELHGDRSFKDDKAIVGGWGSIDKKTYMLIGQQKGRNTKERQFRNFGMANPEGYRKALRLMKLAEKFNKPVVCFIDTPGAYPGLEAEERGQGQAIANNIIEMCKLKTQIICVVIGEGASGGALGIGIGDKILMLENSWYSVISPENCSTILWRSWDFKEKAAESLKLTAEDMYKLNLVDEIIKEPLGGAHTFPEKTINTVKKKIQLHFNELSKSSLKELTNKRINKFTNMGKFKKENESKVK